MYALRKLKSRVSWCAGLVCLLSLTAGLGRRPQIIMSAGFSPISLMPPPSIRPILSIASIRRMARLRLAGMGSASMLSSSKLVWCRL